MITVTELIKGITKDTDFENDMFFYKINVNQFHSSFYHNIEGVIERQDDIYYCLVIDDFYPNDLIEKEFTALKDTSFADCEKWVIGQMNKEIAHYKKMAISKAATQVVNN